MEKTDHDRLVTLDERTKTILTSLNNHIKHHFTINIIIGSAALSAFTSLVILLLK